MTEYLILAKTETDGGYMWDELKGTVEASSARQAVARAGHVAGEYVAVPARSWRPLTVKTEQVTKVTIG